MSISLRENSIPRSSVEPLFAMLVSRRKHTAKQASGFHEGSVHRPALRDWAAVGRSSNLDGRHFGMPRQEPVKALLIQKDGRTHLWDAFILQNQLSSEDCAFWMPASDKANVLCHTHYLVNPFFPMILIKLAAQWTSPMAMHVEFLGFTSSDLLL